MNPNNSESPRFISLIINNALDFSSALAPRTFGYKMFYDAGKIHSSIGNWQKAWNKIAEHQLLIEYLISPDRKGRPYERPFLNTI